LLWDQLDLIADPEAHKAWRTAERKLMNEKGQGMWWRRGEALPHRLPDLETLWQD
jgi:hypothetical protein